MISQDHVWVGQVCAGDKNAYRYLIRAYQDMGYAIAFSVVKDSHIAQEVVQDAFLKAYQRIHLFNRQASFKTWFYRIVTNESLMRLRKMKRDNLSFIALPETEDDNDFLIEINQEQLIELTNQALHLLPAKESLVLRLFYLQEMDLKTVAESTGWRLNNIKVILHRARKRLKRILSDMIKKNTNEAS